MAKKDEEKLDEKTAAAAAGTTQNPSGGGTAGDGVDDKKPVESGERVPRGGDTSDARIGNPTPAQQRSAMTPQHQLRVTSFDGTRKFRANSKLHIGGTQKVAQGGTVELTYAEYVANEKFVTALEE